MSFTDVSIALLWGLVILQLLLLVAILRHLANTTLRERPHSARPQEQGPAIRAEPTRLTLVNLRGESIELEKQECRFHCVVFLAPSSPVCKQLLDAFQEVKTPELQRACLFIIKGSEKGCNEVAEQYGLDGGQVVVDVAGAAAWKWDVHTTPFVVVLGGDRWVMDTGYASGRLQLEQLLRHRLPGSGDRAADEVKSVGKRAGKRAE